MLRMSRNWRIGAGAGMLLLLCSFARAEESGRAMARAASVGAWEVVWEAKGIEVRDCWNQPVSRDALVAGLRQGGAAVEREAASLSELKALAFLLEYLDRLWQGEAVRCPHRPLCGRCDSVSVLLRELKSRPPQAAAGLTTTISNSIFLPEENRMSRLTAGQYTPLRC